MHYYKRNLGDYAKKAGRLSMLQHGSYTLLIDACYDREQFPTMEEAIEWTWASTTEEIEAVQFVLRKFFILKDGVYVQTRIQEELAEYRLKAETNKRIATERETKRKEKYTNRAPVVNEPPPNHKPLTINQEPLTKNQEEQPPAQPEHPKTAKPKIAAVGSSGDGQNPFDEFWKAYPKKTGKEDARRVWVKLKINASLAHGILKALAWQVESDQWRKDGGQYIPNPSTYLNQGRWQDEPPPTRNNTLTPIGRKSAEATNRWLESQEVRIENHG